MSLVKSLSVGLGDMFYVRHNSDNFTIIDCCMCDDNEARLVNELKRESEDKGITRFISTHPDDDHIRGLTYLHDKLDLLNFYVVENEATKADLTDDFATYCCLRDDPKKAFYIYKGCSRKWMNQGDAERGSSGISVLWPVTSSRHFQEALEDAKEGMSPNNISAIVRYRLRDGSSFLWLGDLDTDFMEEIKDELAFDKVGILFAPHHGRFTGTVPSAWLGQMDPDIIVIGEAPSEHLNYYAGYNTITQNSSGDITFDCQSGKTHVYVSNPDYCVDFLEDENEPDIDHGFYIGTLSV